MPTTTTTTTPPPATPPSTSGRGVGGEGLPQAITTVAIVEDDLVLRTTLARIIDDTPGFRCVATCETAEEALKKLPPLNPAAIIMDLNLPLMPGIECTRRMNVLLPHTPIIILTMYEDGELIFSALEAGACGYLIKRSQPDEVLAAVKEACEGGAPMSSRIARRVVQSFRSPSPAANAAAAKAKLSDRENDLLRYLTEGYSPKEIAAKLDITLPTVRTHLRNIYEKLHVHSRTEAVLKFMGTLRPAP